MRRILGLVAIVAVVLGFAPMPGAGAAPPLDVSIVDSVVIAGDGAFTASGPAVAAGAMCASGTTEVISSLRQDLSSGTALLRIRKVAMCDDGSGTFDIAMRVFLDVATGETTAKWRFSGGTGDRAGLRGHGDLVGIPLVPGTSITDIYEGVIQN